MEKQLKTYRAYANDLSALQMTMEAQEDQMEFTRSLVSASKIIKGSRVKSTIGAVDEYNETMTDVPTTPTSWTRRSAGGASGRTRARSTLSSRRCSATSGLTRTKCSTPARNTRGIPTPALRQARQGAL